MWTNKYFPIEKGWYMGKINGQIIPIMWNKPNSFWVDFTGKTYRPEEIEAWLDHFKAEDDLD